ncbi:MAG: DUF4236 domain-containing protein [Thermoanaerobaculaceae bacterium]
MGFYIRKSFRMGPIRLNLSKSGLGVSIGVPGARVGLTPLGESYVHLGRGGIYVRERISSAKHRSGQYRTNNEANVLYEDTGTTFPASGIENAPTRLQQQLVRVQRRISIYLLLPLGGALALVVGRWLAGLPAVIATSIAWTLLVIWLPLTVFAWRQNRAGTKLGRKLERLLGQGRPLDEEQQREISEALNDKWLTPADRKYQTEVAYLRLVLGIVKDRLVRDEELLVLTQAEKLLNLSNTFIREARADAFREVYLEAIANAELSEPDQAALEHIRERLAIPKEALEKELETVQRLQEVRKIREGKLPAIKPSVPIQKSEVCHYETPARILKEKRIRSFQRGGQKYQVRGLVVQKEGTLLITNKRLLVVHQGATSVHLHKILDLDVDLDRSLLIVTIDGASSPLIITTPDALKAGAVLAAASGL